MSTATIITAISTTAITPVAITPAIGQRASAPRDVTADIPHDVTADVTADITRDIPTDVTAEVPVMNAAATSEKVDLTLSRDITFVEPLPGFDQHADFTLSAIDEAGLLIAMRAKTDTDLRFVLTPAPVFFSDYNEALLPQLAKPVADALDVSPNSADIQLFLMLTVGESLTNTTANMRAPIAIDAVSGRAVQVIVEDTSLSINYPLLET